MKIWREPFDHKKHSDFTFAWVGGSLHGNKDGGVDLSHPKNKPHWVYFVTQGDFTFQFQSLDQIKIYVEYFRKKVHPSTIQSGVTLEHYWQRWFERLPPSLSSNRRRPLVLKALERALVHRRQD